MSLALGTQNTNLVLYMHMFQCKTFLIDVLKETMKKRYCA